MIIDAHTHIYEKGFGGPFNFPCGADDLVKGLDEAGIEKAIVIPLPDVATNKFLARECRRHPSRLYPLYSPDFSDHSTTISKLDRFIESHRIHGLKIHPRVHRVTPQDSIVGELLDWAGEHQLPVLFDVFPYGELLDRLELHPLAFHAVAQQHPTTKIILAHAGGYKAAEAFMVAKSNPNIYLDISFTLVYFRHSSVAQDAAFTAKRLPSGRVMYGSDFPYVPLRESLETARDYLKEAMPEHASAVFSSAAISLYQLD